MSWLPLAMGASSRNLVSTFYLNTVHPRATNDTEPGVAVVEVGLLAALLDDLREARAARAVWMDEGGAAAAGEAAGFPAPGQVPGWRKFKLWRENRFSPQFRLFLSISFLLSFLFEYTSTEPLKPLRPRKIPFSRGTKA